MELIDTHCHLDVEEFDHDRPAILDHCRGLGVSRIIVPGLFADQLPRLEAVCRTDPLLLPAPGYHPIYLERFEPAQLAQLEQVIERLRPPAIGEIGLDYFIEGLDRGGQQRLFEAQLRIAKAVRLPVLLHVRKAHDQVLATLRRLHFAEGGIAHAFNGSEQQARQFIDLGFKLGFGGVMSFERARKIRQLAATLPAEAIVLETDAPDLPPASHAKGRNSPEYLPEILAVLAQLRGETAAQLAALTSANARAILRF